MITPAALYEAIDGTWPAAEIADVGPWRIRNGAGGGKRVSAATALGPASDDDIPIAEDAMRNIGQHPLFMITDRDQNVDKDLGGRRYRIVDPVNAYACSIDALTDIPIPRVTAFAVWEPLAIMTEIWAQGGIGPARLAVMARAKTKTGILARHADKPAGTAFVAVHDGIAMVHAVEVLPHQRRRGMAAWMMRRAAFWARDHGATHMTTLCTDANIAANALYQHLGFTRICGYHYREAPEDA